MQTRIRYPGGQKKTPKKEKKIKEISRGGVVESKKEPRSNIVGHVGWLPDVGGGQSCAG
jgi:hypothetical protein